MWRCVLEESGGACAIQLGTTHLLIGLLCAINLDIEAQVRVNSRQFDHLLLILQVIYSRPHTLCPSLVLVVDQYLEGSDVRAGSRILVNAITEPFSTQAVLSVTGMISLEYDAMIVSHCIIGYS